MSNSWDSSWPPFAKSRAEDEATPSITATEGQPRTVSAKLNFQQLVEKALEAIRPSCGYDPTLTATMLGNIYTASSNATPATSTAPSPPTTPAPAPSVISGTSIASSSISRARIANSVGDVRCVLTPGGVWEQQVWDGSSWVDLGISYMPPRKLQSLGPVTIARPPDEFSAPFWDDTAKPVGCAHKWHRYEGLTERYLFCETCDQKRGWDD